MSLVVSRKLRPSGSLSNLGSFLSLYHSDDYERGTLEVHVLRGVHEISFRLNPPIWGIETSPGSMKEWDVGAWPTYIKLFSNRPIPSQNISDAGFQLDGTGLYTGDISLEDSNVIVVGLTGVPVGIGHHRLTASTGFYCSNGDILSGSIWHGEAQGDVFNRDGEIDFYPNRGGRLNIGRVSVPKSSSIHRVINNFTDARNSQVRILDSSFVESNERSSISGWLYMIYEESPSLYIDYVNPARDAVVSYSPNPTVSIKFSKPLSDSVTGSLVDRVKLTSHTGLDYHDATVAIFHEDTDVVSIQFPSATTGDGAHFLRIDTNDLHARDGEYFFGNRYLYSSYYSKELALVKCLPDLCDVLISDGDTITTGDILTYTGGGWQPAAVPAGGSSSSITGLNDIEDVYITAPSNGDLLNYHSTSGIWENVGASAGDIVTGLNDIGDVYISSPSEGESLTYHSSSGIWENTAVGGAGAPTDAEYIVLSANGTLTDERIISGAEYLEIVDNGGGSTIDISVLTGDPGLETVFATTGNFALHTGDTNNPHGTTTGNIDSFGSYPSWAQFITHTGNESNPHNVTTGNIPSFGSYPSWSQFDTHIGAINPHNTTTGSITSFGSYASFVEFNALSGEFSTHEGASNPHGTTTGDIGSFGSYPSWAQFIAHTGNESNPHNITTGDISDFGGYTQWTDFNTATGILHFHTGATNPHDINAGQVSITDAHGHFDTSSVSGALVELAMRIPVTLTFRASHSTPVGSTRRGQVDSADTDLRFVVPAGYSFEVYGAFGAIEMGSTAGDYTAHVILRREAPSGSTFEVATATGLNGERLRPINTGAPGASIVSFAAGDQITVGWSNDAGSAGSLSSTNHWVNVSGYLEVL